jgi:hypothetical protein
MLLFVMRTLVQPHAHNWAAISSRNGDDAVALRNAAVAVGTPLPA